VGVENNPLVFPEFTRETYKSFDLLFFDFPQIAERRFPIASVEIARSFFQKLRGLLKQAKI